MQEIQPNVLVVAAECRDLAKVGGLGDVVRDLSKALKYLGIPVSIVMPYYDTVKQPVEPVDSFPVQFGSRKNWFVKSFRHMLDGVPIYLLRSEDFFGGSYGDIYIDSDRLGRGPFEDDAQRFAFFSAATLEFLRRSAEMREINVLHCHDWHTGVLLVLLNHDPRYRKMANALRTLFTIHNLDYQGVRPFEGLAEREFQTFAQWFPNQYSDWKAQGALEPLSDPLIPTPCFNAMRAGINLAHAVNTVSPKYAVEITLPDDPARNFIGGRGLEGDLQRCGDRLYGILNGLDYNLNDPSTLTPPFDVDIMGWQKAKRHHKEDLLETLPDHIQGMASRLGKNFKNSDSLLRKMSTYQSDEWKKKPLMVAVTRAVRQKASILLESLDEANTVLQAMLKRELSLIILGTGELESQLEEINSRPNGLFICAFDAELAHRLYVGGDIFLMPSDFEPCGISQMVAMRHGCLPLVSNVGGLSDTVQDMRTGFVYAGANRQEARQDLVDTLDKALDMWVNGRKKWTKMQVQAMSLRFEWKSSATQYLELYHRR